MDVASGDDQNIFLESPQELGVSEANNIKPIVPAEIKWQVANRVDWGDVGWSTRYTGIALDRDSSSNASECEDSADLGDSR